MFVFPYVRLGFRETKIFDFKKQNNNSWTE